MQMVVEQLGEHGSKATVTELWNCAAQAQKCPLSEGGDQGGSQEVCLEEGEAMQGTSQVCVSWQLHSQPGGCIQQQM